MPIPTPGDVHVNRPLTNISIAYIQEATAFIADKAFPTVPVQKQSDRYFKYLKEDWFRSEAKERAPATESAGSGWRIDNTPTYYATVFAVHKDVDDFTRANSDEPIDMDRDATLWVTQQLLLKREQVWAQNYFRTTVWDTDLQGVPAAPGAGQFLQWDQASSTPIEDITGAAVLIAQKTGFRPNVLVLSPTVYNAIRNHPDVLDRIKYTQRGVVTTEILAGLFDVERVLVPWGVINPAPEGVPGDADFDFIFGNHALLVYANPTPSILQPSGGYIFSWTGYLGAGPAGNRIKRFRIEQIGADRIEGEIAFDAKLVAPDLGVFFANAVA